MLRQYPLAGGDAIIQTPIVDPKTGMLRWGWLKWMQDVQQRVQTAITPQGTVAPDAGGQTFVRNTYALGPGTLAPQTNMTVLAPAVSGIGPGSLAFASFVGAPSGQPFFISLACWWDTDAEALTIEVSNNSTTLTWAHDDISLLIGVLV